jgi:hypothetical protein
LPFAFSLVTPTTLSKDPSADETKVVDNGEKSVPFPTVDGRCPDFGG